MTQVKEWSNQELNRKLAELMGYSVTIDKGSWLKKPDGTILADPFNRNTEEIAWSWAPDYCTDPAASLEVQTAAIAMDADGYIKNLQAIRKLSTDKFMTRVMAADLLTATPRERAVSAYITMQQINGQ